MAKNTKPIAGTELTTNGAALNVVNKLYLDTTDATDLDDVTTGKWAWLALDITQITPSANETSQSDADYAGNGFGSTEVTSKRYQLAVTGKRHIGDAAQDYVASKQFAIGNALHTRALWIDNGEAILAEVTLSNIVPTGGNANANQTFQVTIVFNGAPVAIDGKLTMSDRPDSDGTYTAIVAPATTVITPSQH
ncbi:hypothetical protein SN811_05680 [Ligilactobacillus agilis]|uniref:Capsid protein n=1 Tax=Ligilactobacillus agilis TaxID=1601 RepID=A0A6F9Y3Q3_9LACO|nr:phage capsid protein [Ligilactobacillus agilis]GET12068.1 hypothetical protein SN811_05680 [Ligilactobacillus agilis]